MLDTISVAALCDSMPSQLRLTDLSRIELDENEEVNWFRVSAFSKWASSVDDLEQWIDRASEDTLFQYRVRFQEFVKGVAAKEQCFAHFYRTDSKMIAHRLTPDQFDVEGVAVALSEKCAVDIYLPVLGLLLAGHDEFGFTTYYPVEFNEAHDKVIAYAESVGLFAVKPRSNQP
jgi:hypothetical protein